MVTPEHAKLMLTMDATERKAISTGLEYAELLRKHFPEFFLDHVATHKVSAVRLLGVVGSFLSLAHTHLLALDVGHVGMIKFAPSDPTVPLDPRSYWGLSQTSALADLSQGAYVWLREPRPRVYGLGMEVVAPDDQHRNYPRKPSAIERHALALLIWQMVADTSWAVLDETRVAELAIARVGNLDLGRAIATTRPLPRETPLRALCAQLDADKPLGIQLGTVVAYACRRTGNGYADTTTAEIRQNYGVIIELDWYRSAEQFAREREDQQAAGKWANAYSRLAGRLWRSPELLSDLVLAVERTAIAVRRGEDADTRSPYDPRPLINRINVTRTS